MSVVGEAATEAILSAAYGTAAAYYPRGGRSWEVAREAAIKLTATRYPKLTETEILETVEEEILARVAP